MGGAVAVQGNALPQGEANIAHDPAAADVVARATWHHPPMLVGLDVTLAATFTPAIFELLAEQRTPAAAFLDAPMRFYRTFGATFSPTGECPCHDLLAVMAAAHPDICEAPVLPFAVQATPGPAWGATIVDRRVPFFAAAGGDSDQPAHDDGFRPWRIALEVDVDRFRRELTILIGGES